MIVKNGQIIAIGNVNTGGTLSGNGLAESPLGLRDDAVKLTPASSGIDIKKIVAEDGKIEYQLGVSANITVGSTKVEGDKGIKSELQPDGVTYIVSVSGDYLTSADNSLAGKDLILRDNQWVELSAAPETKEYSGGEGIKVENHIISVSSEYYPLNTNPSGYLVKSDLNEYAKSAWVDREFQKKGNYITSAGIAGEYLVLKDNTWVLMPNPGAVYSAGPFIKITDDNKISGYDWNPIIDQKLFTSSFNTYNSAYSAYIENQFSSFSATVSSTYIQSADVPKYSAGNFIKVKPVGENFEIIGHDWTDKIAEKLYTSSFESYSAAYSAYIENQFSSFSSTISSTYIQSADIPVYSARNDYIKVITDGDNYGLSGYDWSDEIAKKIDVTASAGWDVTSYSAGDFIKIVDHKISGYDWTDEIAKKQDELTEYQLSAISSVSGKQDMLSNEQLSAISSVSAIQAFSGNWVTSATETISAENLSYVLKKDGNSSKWEGVDLSEVGKTYKVESETPELLKVTSGDGNTTFTLSAKPYPEVPEIPGISGYGTSAWYDEPNNQYKVSANIVGINGISAEYDSVNNQWNIGASASNLAYLNTSFEKTNAETVTSGTVIKFTNGVHHDITVDNDGYITVPNTVDKMTVCMNATIDNNIPDGNPHNYMLNQFVLSAVNGNALVTTHDYYPSEVGAADSNIAATIQHYPGTKYCVVYLGSDALQQSNLNVHLTMIEEVISMSDNSGLGIEYAGIAPITVNNQVHKIGLNYDEELFTLNENNQLSLAQKSGDVVEPVDAKLFNKLLNSVNQRIVETIPIGMVSSTKDQSIDNSKSYLFRPMIEFDMLSTTTARILTSNCSAGTSSVMVAVYEVDENTALLTPMWWSVNTVLTKTQGQHVLSCHPDCTETRALKPEKLYYVEIIVHGQTTHFLGIDNAFRTDIGAFDIAYGRQNVTSSYSNWNPAKFNNQPAGSLGDTALADFKPYVGFRNDPVNN